MSGRDMGNKDIFKINHSGSKQHTIRHNIIIPEGLVCKITFMNILPRLPTRSRSFVGRCIMHYTVLLADTYTCNTLTKHDQYTLTLSLGGLWHSTNCMPYIRILIARLHYFYFKQSSPVQCDKY